MNTSISNTSQYKNLIDHLASVRNGLLLVGENTEEDFLELGRHLQAGYAAVSELTKHALDAAKIAGTGSENNELINAENIVTKALNDLKKRRELVQSKLVPVKTVVEYLDELNSKRSEIETIAKYLRAVALNIFIETARSEITNANFSIIAGEIKELSENIIDLSKSIRIDSEDAKNRFMAMYLNISAGIKTMNSLTNDAEHSVLDSIQNIKKLVKFSYNAVKQAHAMSQEISKQVGNIVVGLQFHDDMRQRLEHIVMALKNTEALYDEIKLSLEEADKDKLATAHAVVTVQAAQLKNIIEELHDIYDQNRHSFEKIINEITQLVKILSYSANDLAGNYDPFTGLSSALSNFQNLDKRGAELVWQLGEAYSQASDTTRALSNQAKQIHEISRDSHIKALNAIIATQNMGLEGRTLLTLAGEMKFLSQQAGDFVTGVGDIIEAIILAVNNIHIDDDDDAVKTNSSDAGDFPLNNIIVQVTSICDKMQNDSVVLRKQAEKLSLNLAHAKNSLDFFPLIGAELNKQLDDLNKVIVILSPWAATIVSGSSPEIFMNQRYTMKKEREVHEKTLELFSEADDAGIADLEADDLANNEEEQEFDDNIELF